MSVKHKSELFVSSCLGKSFVSAALKSPTVLNLVESTITNAVRDIEQYLLHDAFKLLCEDFGNYLISKGMLKYEISFSWDGNVLYFGTTRVFEPQVGETLENTYIRFNALSAKILAHSKLLIENLLEVKETVYHELIKPMWDNLLVEKFSDSWLFSNYIEIKDFKLVYSQDEWRFQLRLDNKTWGQKSIVICPSTVTALLDSFDFDGGISIADIEANKFYREVFSEIKKSLYNIEKVGLNHLCSYLAYDCKKLVSFYSRDSVKLQRTVSNGDAYIVLKNNILCLGTELISYYPDKLKQIFEGINNVIRMHNNLCELFGNHIMKNFQYIFVQTNNETPEEESMDSGFCLEKGTIHSNISPIGLRYFNYDLSTNIYRIQNYYDNPEPVEVDVYVSPRRYYKKILEYSLPVLGSDGVVYYDKYVSYRVRKRNKSRVYTFKYIHGSKEAVKLSSNQQAKAFREYVKNCDAQHVGGGTGERES